MDVIRLERAIGRNKDEEKASELFQKVEDARSDDSNIYSFGSTFSKVNFFITSSSSNKFP